jgi:Na+/melibiose symporter-like transporter
VSPDSHTGDGPAGPPTPLDEIDSALEALGVDTGEFERPSVVGVRAAVGSPTVGAGRGGLRSRLGPPLPRNFRLLWGATALSNLGDGLRLVALPLLATSVTDDPRLIAGVTVAERLPWLLFILPGGAWADRYDRRVLRIRLDMARAVVMAGLVAVILLDQVSIGMLFLVAALLASAEAVVDSSSIAMVPATVEVGDLERAAGRLGSTELAMNDLAGPPIGGLMFGLAIAIPFGLDALSFAGAALVMAFMSGSYTSGAVETSDRRMRTRVSEGFRWLWDQHLLRMLAVISTALGTASFIGNAVFVLYARETLGLSEFGYGLLLVPGAVGGIIGSLMAPRFRDFPLRVTLSCAVLASGGATWILASTSIPAVAGLLWAVSLGAIMVWNVLTLALRQRLIPNEMLGRVSASYRFLVFLGMPVGAIIGGVLAYRFGVRSAIFVSGSVLIFLGLIIPLLLRGIEEVDARST